MSFSCFRPGASWDRKSAEQAQVGIVCGAG